MPPNKALLIVEGPHDLEFCARLLKPRGFSRIQSFEKLRRDHAFWLNTVPEKWPAGGDLLARHPVPVFFASPQGQSVAVINAAGTSKIARRLNFTLNILDSFPDTPGIDAVGIILDADDALSPTKRFEELRAEMDSLADAPERRLAWPPLPGEVHAGPPRTGMFIMPDNRGTGTLEDLLLEAAACSYPQLFEAAKSYVETTGKSPDLQAEDLMEFHKPAGPQKAIAAAMAGILKPGKAIQVSIQDNRWLEPASMDLPRIRAVRDFLYGLLC